MDAKDLKEILGQTARDIIANGLNFHPNHAGKVKCPLHSEKTASMGWFRDGMMWRCHGCGGQIDIYRYYTEFENMNFIQAKERIMDITGQTELSIFAPANRAERKTYDLPNVQTRPLSQKAIDLMAVRKITANTLEEWDVRESTWNGSDVYVFPYSRDSEQDPTHVTYREVKAKGFKGGCEKNTEPILWGMWHVEDGKPLILTEGQPDAMAVWQSGYRNVVSAPSGANNLTWIETCWEWLKGREIIVWADNDKPGLEFAENIRIRLQNVKVIVADKLKDANEVLFRHGPEKVLAMINDSINEMPSGMLDMAHVEYKTTTEDGIETGFYGYDSYVGDWKEKDLTVVFGRNGEGKTTFISQIIAHCLQKGVKTFLYSGEMSEYKIQDWLYKQLVGNKKEYMDQVQTKYKVIDVIKPEIIKRIKEWHEGLFYLFDRKEEGVANDLDKFFELMELAAKKYGVKLFIIDNLMSKLEEKADSLNSDQANFVQRCKFFAINNKVHIVLVAHPNKLKGEITGEEGNLGKTDISGSNNIPNKADNIIAIERVWSSDGCDAIVTSLKDREVGERKAFKFYFSQKTLRFFNGSTNEKIVYEWERIIEREAEAQEELPWE